jgi:GT2 family glycosyltransferase
MRGQSASTRQLCVESSMSSRAMAVLIVAYRSASKLEKCLLSVGKYLPGHEVHVWDNSGADFPDVRQLADRNQHIHWYVGTRNIGFAAAVNKLAATVPNHDLLLLNPDAELLSPLILTRTAIREPGVAAAGPMVWESSDNEGCPPLFPRRLAPWDRQRTPWDVAYRRLTFLNALGGAAGLGDRLRGTMFSYLHRSQPHEVDGFLAGSCLAIRREAWDAVGSFDEEFFLYQEEAEWQRRAISAGWRLRLADEIGVRHLRKGTVTGDLERLTRSEDLAFANTVLMVEYCYGSRAAEIYLVWTLVFENIRRKVRGRRVRIARPDVLLTADGPDDIVSERVSTALTLASAGYSVVLVSLQRLGILPHDLPPSIRLIRRPWWWPSAAPQDTPPVLVMGTTAKERAFARLFRLPRNRICTSASDAAESLAGLSARATELSSSTELEQG